jgi:hypothetical protein
MAKTPEDEELAGLLAQERSKTPEEAYVDLCKAQLAAGGLLAYLTHAGLKQELRDNEKDRAARRVRTEKDKEGLRAKQADDPLPAGGDAKNVSAVPVFHSGDESAPPDARLLIQQKLAPRLPTPTLGAKPRLIWDAATGVMDPARGGAFEPAGYSKAWPVPQDWVHYPRRGVPYQPRFGAQGRGRQSRREFLLDQEPRVRRGAFVPRVEHGDGRHVLGVASRREGVVGLLGPQPLLVLLRPDPAGGPVLLVVPQLLLQPRVGQIGQQAAGRQLRLAQVHVRFLWRL